jgi:hypothetical protein
MESYRQAAFKAAFSGFFTKMTVNAVQIQKRYPSKSNLREIQA